jgi:hypothetical protein
MAIQTPLRSSEHARHGFSSADGRDVNELPHAPVEDARVDKLQVDAGQAGEEPD